MKFTHKFIAAAVLTSLSALAFAQAGETVKIAWIDPLSGLMAPVGSNQLKDSFNFLLRNSMQTTQPKSSSKSLALTTN
jgi:branched-chain amino acid transport system substrate-binding protein